MKSRKYTIYKIATGEVIGHGFSGVFEHLTNENIGIIFDIEKESGYFINNEFFELAPQPSPHHAFDYTTKQWIDPRTLQDFKDAQWAVIKQARTQAEYAGFTWDGSTFDSDATSQNRITGAVQLAQIVPGFTIDWTLADNTVRTLSAADMAAAGVALGVHVGTQFAKAQALRAQIDAATTQAEVEAVIW